MLLKLKRHLGILKLDLEEQEQYIVQNLEKKWKIGMLWCVKYALEKSEELRENETVRVIRGVYIREARNRGAADSAYPNCLGLLQNNLIREETTRIITFHNVRRDKLARNFASVILPLYSIDQLRSMYAKGLGGKR